MNEYKFTEESWLDWDILTPGIRGKRRRHIGVIGIDELALSLAKSAWIKDVTDDYLEVCKTNVKIRTGRAFLWWNAEG